MSSVPPFGWADDPEDPARLVKNEVEQRAIKRAVELWPKIKTYRGVGIQLQKEGHDCRGRGFSHHIIKRILRREKEAESIR